MSQLILDSFRKYIDLSLEEEQEILNRLHHAQYKAKTVLIKPGDTADFSYFVLDGILKSYTTDANGADHILSFATPGWWMADMYAYLGDNPAIMTIDVVEDCDVLILYKKDVEELYIQIPKLERFFRILTQNNLIANQQRVLDKMTLTAEERYERFLEKFPKVNQCLPQKYIASYIGVTPEFFSKMKSRLLRKK